MPSSCRPARRAASIQKLPSPAIDREAWAAEGKASYQIFIRTLLSITDNIVDDKVVHPEDVVIHDGEDPYFVVAADKGTATFSDIANGIAESRDFWLDDAFASGGSNGYDHKAMGITARGAWVSVQRHFLEMGVDVQTDPVRVVGCGDMSGDVFGNGMLLSKSIRWSLPSITATSSSIPTRMQRRAGKNVSACSTCPVRAGKITTQTDIQGRRGLPPLLETDPAVAAGAQGAGHRCAKSIEPEALISKILNAPVDLIWFGGIGTYIKARRKITSPSAIRRMTACASTRTWSARRLSAKAPTLASRRLRESNFQLRRALQHRFHRQFRRRRLFRPRGQYQDRAGGGQAQRQIDREKARRAAGVDDR